MIADVLPPSVASCAVHGDDVPGRLFPAEAALVAGAPGARVREFTAARLCAHRALGRLGTTARPVGRGPRGEPLWPDGIVGSITHCADYRAACAAWGRDVAAVGIDAEDHAPLPDGVLDQVATAPERAWLATAPAGPHWDRVLFSAKESLFKAWHPLARRWLGFEDAVVTLHPDAGTFEARLLVAPPRLAGHAVTDWPGRFVIRDGLVVTSVVVPRRGA